MNTTIDKRLVSQIETGTISRRDLIDALIANLCRTLHDWGAPIRDIGKLIGMKKDTVCQRLTQSVHLDAICDASERAASQIGAAIMIMVQHRIAEFPVIDVDHKRWKKARPSLERWVKLSTDLERHRARPLFVAHSRGGAFLRKPKPKEIEPIEAPEPEQVRQEPSNQTPEQTRRDLVKLLEGMALYFRETSNTCYSEYEILQRFRDMLEKSGHFRNAISRAISIPRG